MFFLSLRKSSIVYVMMTGFFPDFVYFVTSIIRSPIEISSKQHKMNGNIYRHFRKKWIFVVKLNFNKMVKKYEKQIMFPYNVLPSVASYTAADDITSLIVWNVFIFDYISTNVFVLSRQLIWDISVFSRWLFNRLYRKVLQLYRWELLFVQF